MERTFVDFYPKPRGQKTRAFGGFAKWLWGIGGFATFTTAYVLGFLNAFLPGPPELVCMAREQMRSPAPGTHFTILVSSLSDDADGRQTRLVRDAFLGQRGIDVRQTCRVVELDAIGGSVADAEAAALERGRRLMERWNADLLLWGEVKKADQELVLRFLGSGTRRRI